MTVSLSIFEIAFTKSMSENLPLSADMYVRFAWFLVLSCHHLLLSFFTIFSTAITSDILRKTLKTGEILMVNQAGYYVSLRMLADLVYLLPARARVCGKQVRFEKAAKIQALQ